MCIMFLEHKFLEQNILITVISHNAMSVLKNKAKCAHQVWYHKVTVLNTITRLFLIVRVKYVQEFCDDPFRKY